MASQDDPQSYYRSHGKRIRLKPDPDLVAVRYARDGRDSSALLDSSSARLLRSAVPVDFIPNHGVQILRAPSAGAEEAAALIPIDRDSHVDFAAPLHRVEGSDDEPVLVLPQVVARFPDHLQRADIETLLREYGARIVEARPELGNTYVLRSAQGFGPEGPIALANRLIDDGHAVKASPDIVRRVEFRATDTARQKTAPTRRRTTSRSSAPEFDGEQWHLDTAKVRPAWATTRGAGVTVAILDDGVATDHAEFSGRVKAERDFAGGGNSAKPVSSSDNHGTACAGVALAGGVKATGAAPAASMIAVRTPVWLGTSEEIDMFRWCANQGATVVSCSWGPAQPHALPDMVDEVLSFLANDARSGRGVLVLFAAGNESEDMSTDGYAASPHVMAIAASTDQEDQSWYSDFGSEIDLCAPSSGGTKHIFTTDRPGSDGYNAGSDDLGDPSGDYTNDFGGTSSATPLVAGVAALVFSANPGLKASEVRDILQFTADKIGDSNEYTNGHSPRFGYGRVNAEAAVDEAVRRVAGVGSDEGAPSNSSTQDSVSVEGPASLVRHGAPPEFSVSTSLPFWAIEVATDPTLFDGSTSGRTTVTFYSSFEGEGASTGDRYRLPDEIWARLSHAESLAYRAIAASSAQGDGAVYSTPDDDASNAPRIPIRDSADAGPSPVGAVRFPSGATFRIVDTPSDGEDYSDPVAGGLNALIDTQGRLDEQVSENFTLRELAARSTRYRYARVSTELVRGLQAMRSAVGAAITLRSAYRPPALNASVGGASRSQHLAGRAADIKVSGLTPLEVAALALQHLGSEIGLGLGETSTHVDLRGALTTWVYTGAELSEKEFDEWARREARRRHGLRGERSESTHRDGPTVEGPLEWPADRGAPEFLVYPGQNAFVALEMAADPELFWPKSTGATRTPRNFAATWERGLQVIGRSHDMTLRPDPALWKRLAGASRVYYRVVTSARDDGSWVRPETSLVFDELDLGPSVAVVRAARDTDWVPDDVRRRHNESKWRRPHG